MENNQTPIECKHYKNGLKIPKGLTKAPMKCGFSCPKDIEQCAYYEPKEKKDNEK